MPYQRRGEAAEPTPPQDNSEDVDGEDDAPKLAPQITKARKSLWIIGLAIGAYMIISGIVQAILTAQH